MKEKAMSRKALCVAAFAITALLAGGGSVWAHYRTGGDWYFYGSFYESTTPHDATRKDPVNLIFFGGGLVTNSGVASHIETDWRYGRMRHSKICNSKMYAIWRFMPGRGSDNADFQRSNKALPCNNQYHVRGWDDYEHWQGTAHGNRYQWVIAGVHHEDVKYKFPCCFHHVIDRDWDSVRVEAVKAMSAHCSYRHWQYHPGAHRTYQGFTNYGYIARISMRHVSAGCDGA